jgi:hypothetical protein
MLTEIVKRALVYTVTDIGQLSATEKRELNAAVKRGYLSKGKGGPFPALKTMYAHPGFDFIADRQREVDEAMRIAAIDDRMRAARKGSPV